MRQKIKKAMCYKHQTTAFYNQITSRPAILHKGEAV